VLHTAAPNASTTAARPPVEPFGLPWQHTRGSALLGFVADDAAHVAADLARTAAATDALTPQP
jgi:hypothetical protein